MIGDIIASVLIYSILVTRGYTPYIGKLGSYLWLFNPLTITVSTRGNAESIMAVLVLSTLYFLIQKTSLNNIMAACVYALAVHMKIYPITYSLPMYLFMNSDYFCVAGRPKNLLDLDIWPSLNRIKFIAIGMVILFGLTGLFWNM